MIYADRNLLAQIPVARKSLKAAASRPRRSWFPISPLAHVWNLLVQIPVARKSLKAAAPRRLR